MGSSKRGNKERELTPLERLKHSLGGIVAVDGDGDEVRGQASNVGRLLASITSLVYECCDKEVIYSEDTTLIIGVLHHLSRAVRFLKGQENSFKDAAKELATMCAECLSERNIDALDDKSLTVILDSISVMEIWLSRKFESIHLKIDKKAS